MTRAVNLSIAFAAVVLAGCEIATIVHLVNRDYRSSGSPALARQEALQEYKVGDVFVEPYFSPIGNYYHLMVFAIGSTPDFSVSVPWLRLRVNGREIDYGESIVNGSWSKAVSYDWSQDYYRHVSGETITGFSVDDLHAGSEVELEFGVRLHDSSGGFYEATVSVVFVPYPERHVAWPT